MYAFDGLDSEAVKLSKNDELSKQHSKDARSAGSDILEADSALIRPQASDDEADIVKAQSRGDRTSLLLPDRSWWPALMGSCCGT